MPPLGTYTVIGQLDRPPRYEICHECGNNGEYNGKPLVLQLDHIDGNSDNNLPENLRWMCPNCHSQTPTYGRKGRTLKETKREEYRRKHYKSSK